MQPIEVEENQGFGARELARVKALVDEHQGGLLSNENNLDLEHVPGKE